jgi:predicted ATP-dependent serine protease
MKAFQKINPTNKKKRILEIIDLKKFINKIRLNSGFEIKRISKLFALIETHIKIYANIAKKLDIFLKKNFNIDSSSIYFKLL